MTFLDALLTTIESTWFYYFCLVALIILMLLGILMLIGIKKKGKVIIIDFLLRNKKFDNEALLSRYTIQALYTIIISIIIFIVTVTKAISILNIVYIMLGLAVLDFVYDVVAIKSVIKKRY